MTIATRETKEEKKRLIERANALKPRVSDVIATERGWAIIQPRGAIELLISFPGLDALLGEYDEAPMADDLDFGEGDVSVSTIDKFIEPVIEGKTEEVIKDEPVVEDKDEDDEPVIVAPAKRGPKPKVK